MTRTAFFSHKTKDAELAKQFRDALERVLPLRIFLSEEMKQGNDFRREIWLALEKASFFILLFTDPSEGLVLVNRPLIVLLVPRFLLDQYWERLSVDQLSTLFAVSVPMTKHRLSFEYGNK